MPAAALDSVTSPSHFLGALTNDTASPTPLSPLRVLVVDDEDAPRRVAAALLAAEGHTTVSASGGHEALVGHLPMTGEELTFRLEDLESFQVIGD
jgi:PleD family two-component response regulator